MSLQKPTPTQQTIVLLALVASSLITVRENNMIPELQDKTEESVKKLLDIIAEYRDISDPQENVLETSEILKRVSKEINKSEEWFSVDIVVQLGYQVCSDLLGEVCSNPKRELLLQALEELKTFDNFLDPDGDNLEAIKGVEEILQTVYKEIGFSTELRYLKYFKKLQRRMKQHGNKARLGEEIHC